MSRVSSLIVLVLAIFALIALFSNPTNVVAAHARHHRYLTHDDDSTATAVENFDQAEEEDREESCGYYWANSLNGYMTSCNVVSFSDHGSDCYRYCPSVFSACQWICPNSMSDLSAEEELLVKMKKRAMDKKKALIVKLRKQWANNKKKLLTQLNKKKAALKKRNL